MHASRAKGAERGSAESAANGGANHTAEGFPGKVVEQRVEAAVGCGQAECDHKHAHKPPSDLVAPALHNGMEVQRAQQVVGQEAQEEGAEDHRHQVDRAAAVLPVSPRPLLPPCQREHNGAVAAQDDDEGQEET